MTDELVFFTNPRSRGRIVRWMLEEVGAPYRAEYLDYGSSMKVPDYLAINPMGKVPAIRHGERIVTEVAAICAYLADAFPQSRLAPELGDRAGYYRWLFFAAGPLEAAIVNRSLGFDAPPESEPRLGYGNFASTMDTMEWAVSQTGYIAGTAFTAADIVAGSQIGFGLQFGTIDKRPAFETYWSRISDREAYRRASEIDNAAIEADG